MTAPLPAAGKVWEQEGALPHAHRSRPEAEAVEVKVSLQSRSVGATGSRPPWPATRRHPDPKGRPRAGPLGESCRACFSSGSEQESVVGS